MADYIKLTAAPHWCVQYPTYSACGTEKPEPPTEDDR